MSAARCIRCVGSSLEAAPSEKKSCHQNPRGPRSMSARSPGGGRRASLAEERPSSMQSLWHQFREGGWVMYPVFALGLVAVGAAARFALRGEHQLLPFIRWVIVSLLLTGAFGFTLAMMKTLHAAQKPSEPM